MMTMLSPVPKRYPGPVPWRSKNVQRRPKMAKNIFKWCRTSENVVKQPKRAKSLHFFPVNPKAFMRWARQYKSLHPAGPSTQKPSSGGPVNTKALIRWWWWCWWWLFVFNFYIHKLPINRLSGRYMLSLSFCISHFSFSVFISILNFPLSLGHWRWYA